MKLESRIRILAGTLVLLSVSLGYLVSSWWLILAAFVGLNLIQSAFTGFCPAERMLSRLRWHTHAQHAPTQAPP